MGGKHPPKTAEPPKKTDSDSRKVSIEGASLINALKIENSKSP